MTTLIEETSGRLLPRIVLIACGSFSPPTPMHLRMFEIARDHFELQGIYNVIGGIISPTHDSYGKRGLVSATHRCTMLKLALKSSNWIRLSEWETQQETWSRTQSVLHYHQNFMNNVIHTINENDCNSDVICDWLPSTLHHRKDPVQLKLLCGADLLQSFAVPGLWLDSDIEDIVGNHGLVVISRNGTNPEKFIFESDLLSKYQKNITLLPNWVPNEVSSTLIRRLLSRGQSVKYLLDDLVVNYISEHGLYGSKNNSEFKKMSDANTLSMLRLSHKYEKSVLSYGEEYVVNNNKDEFDGKPITEIVDDIPKKNQTTDNNQKDIINRRSRSNISHSPRVKQHNKHVHNKKGHSNVSLSFDQIVEQNDKITSKKIKMA